MTQDFLRKTDDPLRLRIGVSLEERLNGQVEDCSAKIDIPALNALALRSLASLFDEKEGLFSRRLILTSDGLHREGGSRKRTIIALLGLQRIAELTGSQPFDIDSIRDVILRDTSWVESLADLGLLIWFTSECAQERLRKLLNEFDFETALGTFSDGRQVHTRAVAWFLAGISHARLACPRIAPDLTDVAVDAFHLLQDNQGESGIYGRASNLGFPRDVYWRRFGTFSDQIFPIYALTTFARAFQIEEPLSAALSCANSVCSLQGDHGEWWSLYDKHACRVVTQYPVHSSHQDGTAPLALFALEEATGQTFHESTSKGLSWLAGLNELGGELRNFDRGFIWDSIDSTGWIGNTWEAAAGFFSLQCRRNPKTLRIRREARPDHFGWLLYALGGFGFPNPAMAAKAATAG